MSLSGSKKLGYGTGILLQELLGRLLRVLAVDGQERHLLAALAHLPLEERELEAAGPAPGGPLVDHDRISAQRGEAGA